MNAVTFYITDLVRRYHSEDEGLALTEYLVLLGILTAALIAAIGLFGDALNVVWRDWTTWIGANLKAPT